MENKTQNDAIINWLKSIEQKNFFKIILAVETGSRGRNLNVSTSDFDIKGFYIAEKSESQIKTSQLNCKKDKITINQIKFDVDYTFLDFKMFLKGQSYEAARLFLFSETKYVDLIPSDLKKQLQLSLKVPKFHTKGSVLSLYERQIQKKKAPPVKRILNLCVSICEHLYFQDFDTFQDYAYDYWQMSSVLYNKLVAQNKNKKHINLVKEIINYSKQLFEIKKKDHAATINSEEINQGVLNMIEEFKMSKVKVEEITQETEEFYKIAQKLMEVFKI